MHWLNPGRRHADQVDVWPGPVVLLVPLPEVNLRVEAEVKEEPSVHVALQSAVVSPEMVSGQSSSDKA